MLSLFIWGVVVFVFVVFVVVFVVVVVVVFVVGMKRYGMKCNEPMGTKRMNGVGGGVNLFIIGRAGAGVGG